MASLLCLQDVEKLLVTLQSFYSQIMIAKRGTHLKCRLLMLREVVKWRCTIEAGILRNSALV
jgi:hypothetical protein